MAKDGLINCKKCGTLFFKNSGREVCEECFKKELEIIDAIRNYTNSQQKNKITIEVNITTKFNNKLPPIASFTYITPPIQ
jgi:protein-arginine kinase activator protein McsA